MRFRNRSEADIPGVGGASFVVVDDAEVTYRWDLKIDDDALGAVRMRVDSDEGIQVGIGFTSSRFVDDAVVDWILTNLERISAQHGGAPARVNVQDPLVRHRLRAAGYVGGLRDGLTTGVAQHAEPSDLEAVRSFVPHLDIVVKKASRRALRLEVSGGGVEVPLEVGMPRRPVLAEQIAAIFDTTFAVRKAFAPLVDGVRRIHFRDVVHGEPASRRPAAQAIGSEHVVIDSHFVYVADLLSARRDYRTLGPTWREVLSVAWPFTPTDAVVAHELWHLFGDEIVGTGDDRVAFSRALGEVLGGEDLEDALVPADVQSGSVPTAAPTEAAMALAQQVSPYATTRWREATAEMFRMWWCSGDQVSPVVARFGELVEGRLGRPARPARPAETVTRRSR